MVTYTNNEIEQYNISKLTDDSLELNFVTAAGIRGIAKVSCVKI
ncbi:hypothetical protein [Niabella ginsengisoli]|nr:hypothetical protein [Niabella ginsengisoli]